MLVDENSRTAEEHCTDVHCDNLGNFENITVFHCKDPEQFGPQRDKNKKQMHWNYLPSLPEEAPCHHDKGILQQRHTLFTCHSKTQI